jgi:hypothetical protein
VFETEQTRHFATAPRDDRKSVGMDGPDGIGRHRSKSRIPHRYQSPLHPLSPQFRPRSVRFA